MASLKNKMENYIDIGIDFGAENIVVIAIGYDNKGRSDYKLINLHSSGSIKNYIGEKINGKIEIGQDIKISYIYRESSKDFNWICGRYKAFIAEANAPFFEKKPDELLKFGLEEVIKKIEAFDFSPILSGELRNLTVGVPQSWGFSKKLLYRDILTIWKYGTVSLLSEPVAATIAAYNRSSSDIGNNIIMILDIGASTFDISFAKYLEEMKTLDIYKTTYRSEKAGHYFDLVFTSFTLMSDINKFATLEIIDKTAKLKLRKIEDYIEYLQKNQSKYSSLLLEIETLKENHLLEVVKFSRKKLIDIGTKTPITVTKQIYTDSLNYYVSKISSEINNIILQFKETENLNEKEIIYPFLCGGASSLNNLEKSLKEQLNSPEKDRLFSIIKEGQGSKIDTTIAVGLAQYAQNKSIISKKLEYSVGVKIPVDEGNERKDFWLLNEGESYPLEADKKFSETIGSEKELQYFGNGNGKISFPVIQKSNLDGYKEHLDIISITMDQCDRGDSFDLLFNVDIDGIITISIRNITKELTINKTLSMKNSFIVEGGLLIL